MQERRRYVRLNIPLEVSYTLQGEEEAQHKAITKNISAGGTRFTLEKDLPKGTVLDLCIKIPTQAEPIPLKAKIVWSRKETAQGKDVYDAGFEFSEIPEESKKIFFQYLCNIMYERIKQI